MTEAPPVPIPNCRCCGLIIQPGQLFIGLPILRIANAGRSVMTGGEILMHILCFLEKVKDKKVLEIVK